MCHVLPDDILLAKGNSEHIHYRHQSPGKEEQNHSSQIIKNQIASLYILLAEQQLWISAFLNLLSEGVEDKPSEKALGTISVLSHLSMRPTNPVAEIDNTKKL